MIWTDCYKELVEIIRSKDEFLASIRAKGTDGKYTGD